MTVTHKAANTSRGLSFTEVLMKIQFIWNVIPCQVVNILKLLNLQAQINLRPLASVLVPRHKPIQCNTLIQQERKAFPEYNVCLNAWSS
jgi:hypothetical protein